MSLQKFVIQYESDKPLFPINTFEFLVNPEYAAENLKTLRGMLQILLRSLIFIPLDKSISDDYNKMQENLEKVKEVEPNGRRNQT